jgi:hypothetical protein
VADRVKLLAWLDNAKDVVPVKFPPNCEPTDMYVSVDGKKYLTTDAITLAIKKSGEMWARTHALNNSRVEQLYAAGMDFTLSNSEARLFIFDEAKFNAWRTSDIIVEVMKFYEAEHKRKAALK